MARIAGIDLPENKRTDIGLTYIFGIGRSNVVKVLSDAGVDGSTRIKDLTEDEVNEVIQKLMVLGNIFIPRKGFIQRI